MTAAARTASAVRRIVAKTIPHGATREGGINWRVDLAGRCERSVTVSMYGRGQPKPERFTPITALAMVRSYLDAYPGAEVVEMRRNGVPVLKAAMGVLVRETEASVGLTMEVPCRKCSACLRARQYRWQQRAEIETTRAARTWFGTLTLRPQAREHFKNLARMKYSKIGDFETLSEVQQFQRLVNAIGVEFTAMLKRIREQCGGKLRYMMVAERHQDGEPHLHVLVHEVDAEAPVSWEQLAWRHRHGSEPAEQRRTSSQWAAGFYKWKLIEGSRQAAYVCKYLSKDARARVRSSMRYGKIVTYVPKNEVL